jgi:hypothetical protein
MADLQCKLRLLWVASVKSMKEPQRDWKSWEALGVSFYRMALKNPSEFPVRIRFALQALRNAHEIAYWDAAPELIEKVQRELVYVEEMEGNFLFLNDTFSTSRVRVLNNGSELGNLVTNLWSPDDITVALASAPRAESTLNSDFERIRLETENMMAALKVSYLMLHRFSDEFLNEYFRDPNSSEALSASEIIYAAAPHLMGELMARVLYLLKNGDLEEGLERADRLLSVILLLPSDARTSQQLQMATGEILSPDPQHHRYQVGFRVANIFVLWRQGLFEEVESRSLELDRQDISDRWTAWVRAPKDKEGQELLESASQTRLYLLKCLSQLD